MIEEFNDVLAGNNSVSHVDTLAQHEHGQIHNKPRISEPEKALMFAILEDAVYVIEKGLVSGFNQQKTCKNKSWICKHAWRGCNFHEAIDWILVGDGESDYPFSFIHICETLGFDPESMRSGILKIAESHLGAFEQEAEVKPASISEWQTKKTERPGSIQQRQELKISQQYLR